MGWNDTLAAADAQLASFFDEQTVTAQAFAKPSRSPNAAASPDPSRESFEFRGTIELDPDFNAGGPRVEPGAIGQATRHVSRICLTALAVDWPWIPRQGDRLACDGVTYAIVAQPDRDGTDRVAFWLNKVA